MRKFNKSAVISILLFILLVVLTGSIMILNDNSTKFNKNIKIDNISVSGMNKDDAIKVVSKNMHNKVDDMVIEIKYEDKNWILNNFKVDEGVQTVVNNVFKATKFKSKDVVKFVANQTGSFQTAISDIYVDLTYPEAINNLLTQQKIIDKKIIIIKKELVKNKSYIKLTKGINETLVKHQMLEGNMLKKESNQDNNNFNI